jgi:virginiamycin A acetyltransferase
VSLIGQVSIGRFATVGANVTIHGGEVSIGRYSQIGPSAAIYALNHAQTLITTYNNSRLFGGQLKQLIQAAPVVIGHDVWIGHGAIILLGVVIGNGAIIGAGSVVTKNVCNFGVAVGNPARVMRKRFDEEMIDLLTKSQWWRFSPTELEPYRPNFMLDIESHRGEVVAFLCLLCEQPSKLTGLES